MSESDPNPANFFAADTGTDSASHEVACRIIIIRDGRRVHDVASLDWDDMMSALIAYAYNHDTTPAPTANPEPYRRRRSWWARWFGIPNLNPPASNLRDSHPHPRPSPYKREKKSPLWITAGHVGR